MTVSQLIEALQQVPPETEICCRVGSNDIGNIWSPCAVELSTSSFLGRQYPCVIIEHSTLQMWSGKDRTQGTVIWQEEDCDDNNEPAPPGFDIPSANITKPKPKSI